MCGVWGKETGEGVNIKDENSKKKKEDEEDGKKKDEGAGILKDKEGDRWERERQRQRQSRQTKKQRDREGGFNGENFQKHSGKNETSLVSSTEPEYMISHALPNQGRN